MLDSEIVLISPGLINLPFCLSRTSIRGDIRKVKEEIVSSYLGSCRIWRDKSFIIAKREHAKIIFFIVGFALSSFSSFVLINRDFREWTEFYPTCLEITHYDDQRIVSMR